MTWPTRTGLRWRFVPQSIRKAFGFIADIDGPPTFEDNLRDNPRAAAMYANSIYNCLASSMTESDSVGYGTLGLPELEMEKLARGAGFTRFRQSTARHTRIRNRKRPGHV